MATGINGTLSLDKSQPDPEQGQIGELHYDINGECWHWYNAGMAMFLSGSRWQCYGGYGGNVVRSSALLRSNLTEANVGVVLRANNGIIASDELLSAIILMSGGTIGRYNGFTNHPWLRWIPGVVVVHQAKSLYSEARL